MVNVGSLSKEEHLDLPLASKTSGQLTPPAKTSFRVIQGLSNLCSYSKIVLAFVKFPVLRPLHTTCNGASFSKSSKNHLGLICKVFTS